MKKKKYADLMLLNVHKNNEAAVYKHLSSLIKKKVIGHLTQIFVLVHKNSKNPMLGYEIGTKVSNLLAEIKKPELILKDLIFVVKIKPQYMNSTHNEINLHGHSLFAFVNKDKKFQWRDRRYAVGMRLLNTEFNDENSQCCGDVWLVKNHKQTEFPRDLMNGIIEFANVPEDSNIIKVGFDG
jgi:hypothetical protein